VGKTGTKIFFERPSIAAAGAVPISERGALGGEPKGERWDGKTRETQRGSVQIVSRHKPTEILQAMLEGEGCPEPRRRGGCPGHAPHIVVDLYIGRIGIRRSEKEPEDKRKGRRKKRGGKRP